MAEKKKITETQKTGKKCRPQNKNLIWMNERPPEEARAIQSAGGKASAEARRKRQALSDMLLLYSELPIKDGRVRNRLTRLGVSEAELTQKFQVADALIRSAQSGSVQAIALYLDSIGELKVPTDIADNNLFEMIEKSGTGEVDVSDIPELQQEAEPDDDMVDPSGAEEL